MDYVVKGYCIIVSKEVEWKKVEIEVAKSIIRNLS